MKRAGWVAFAVGVAVTLGSVGCGLGAKDNFTRGLTRDRCDGTFPICQTTAGCAMGPGRYIEGSFPGSRQFIVPAPEEAFIEVQLFFATEIATGVDTEILWHEPGCFDTYQWLSEGSDIFLAAGNDRILRQRRQVFLGGDHLIEVFSDAIAEYAIRVEVQTSSGGSP